MVISGLYSKLYGMNQENDPIFAEKIKAESDEITKGILAHEAAHKSEGGIFAEGEVIDWGTDQFGNKVAKGGHVKIIQAPIVTFHSGFDEIEQAESHARKVARSAIAPAIMVSGKGGDLSDADMAVYDAAMRALSAAENAKS